MTSCAYNLVLCHADETGCREHAERMIDACAWNTSGGRCVDAARCRLAVRRFYTAHAQNSKRFRSLLFCGCEAGDQLCASVRRAFHPACTAAELPPPSCHDVIHTCNQQADCRYVYTVVHKQSNRHSSRRSSNWTVLKTFSLDHSSEGRVMSWLKN